MKKVCLVVIDGWGLNEEASEAAYDAIRQGDAPLMTSLCANLVEQPKDNHINIKRESRADKKPLDGENRIQEATDSTMNTSLIMDGMCVSAVKLAAHGTAVGLPAGLMGNSEVGHLNIGAGRVVYQDIVRITTAIESDTLATQGAMPQLIEAGKKRNRIHLVSLVSDGGVHAHSDHLEALVDLLLRECPKATLCLHAILDGRDTPPTSAPRYLSRLLHFIDAKNQKLAFNNQKRVHQTDNQQIDRTFDASVQNYQSDKNCDSQDHSSDRVKLCSVMGRYWAMDRDERWERTGRAAACLRGVSELEVVEIPQLLTHVTDTCYTRGETDEFIKPFLLTNYVPIEDEDVILFVNYRSDRMRQLVSCFVAPDLAANLYPSRKHLVPSQAAKDSTGNLEDYTRFASYLNAPSDCSLYSMTQYHAGFTDAVAPLFAPLSMTNVLAEWLAIQGKTQCHIAETEKYAHVTFFFNGGREAAYMNEQRLLIPSPRVPTYDLAPAMSVYEVSEAVAQALPNYDVIICNLAPPDMVGHTGNFEATKEAVHHTDKAIKRIWEACQLHQVTLLITADHGNAEKMKDAAGAIHTAHTSYPVPFILAQPAKNSKKVNTSSEEANPVQSETYYLSAYTKSSQQPAALCDVAPTLLALLGLPQPPEMTGMSLLRQHQS